MKDDGGPGGTSGSGALNRADERDVWIGTGTSGRSAGPVGSYGLYGSNGRYRSYGSYGPGGHRGTCESSRDGTEHG